jgi:hypothetical protein
VARDLAQRFRIIVDLVVLGNRSMGLPAASPRSRTTRSPSSDAR